MESHQHKIVPPVYVLISALIILLLHFVIPGPTIFPKPWNLLGILPLLLGLVPPVMAVMAFRRAGTSPEPFHEPAAMVTNRYLWHQPQTRSTWVSCCSCWVWWCCCVL